MLFRKEELNNMTFSKIKQCNDDMNSQSEKGLTNYLFIISIVMMLLGIGFFSYSVYICKQDVSVDVDAIVTQDSSIRYDADGDSYFETYLTFEYDGQTYRKRLETSTQSNNKGDIVTISINKNNPNLSGYNKPQYIYLFFTWFGGMLLGFFILIEKINKNYEQ